MPINKGLLREDEMIVNLNNKKVSELSINLRNLVEALFGALLDDEVITCERMEGSMKPDFAITYQGETKYVSMKSGRSDTLHCEYIKPFILFLRELGISNRTQKTILLFHYGDGTMDGSGTTRMDYEDLCMWLKDRIKDANEELNSDYNFINKVIDRCIFDGASKEAISADIIYHGDYQEGFHMNKKQAHKYVKNRKFTWAKKLHIGPMFLRPQGRYIGREVKSEKKRHSIEVYWPHFKDSIDYVSRNYDSYVRR